MNNSNYFRVLFESMTDYREIVFLMFLIKSGNDFLTECGFLKSDFNRLCREFKKISIEQNEDFLNYFKNEEESFIEKIFKK